MKVQAIKTSSVLAILTATAAAQEYTTSKPFNLHIAEASNNTLNGWILSACHAGAAIEGLCVYNDGPFPPSTTFMHNTTDWWTIPTGPLVWNLPARIDDSPVEVPSRMALSYVPWSNIAVPLFSTGTELTPVGFDADGKVFVLAYGDDKRNVPINIPPTAQPHPLYNWFVCWAYVGGYYYHALAWATVLPPQNPTCNSVNVTRSFIESS